MATSKSFDQITVMAERSSKFPNPAAITVMYEDDVEFFIGNIHKITEHEDGSLEIWHENKVTRVRPTYRIYQIDLSYGDFANE